MSPTTVILGFAGGMQTLRGCLTSLLATTDETVAIIVVVNCEGALKLDLGVWPARVSFLRIEGKIGNANALNAGVQEAKTDHVVLADYDLLFQPGWLDALYEALPAQGAVACPMLLDPVTNLVSEFGIAYTKFNGAHPHKDLPSNHPLVARRHSPQAICSGGMLLSRGLFLSLGGFNPSLATMYGDVDFALRLKRAGVAIIADPKAKIYHLGGWDAQRARDYKNLLLKGDHKGAFVWDNRDALEVDLGDYFARSVAHHTATQSLQRSVVCQALTVADGDWYIAQVAAHGGDFYEVHRNAAPYRDARQVNLLELFGYDVMVLRVPVAYFVDRCIGVWGNEFWWRNRDFSQDIVVDRNANIASVGEVLSWAYA